MRCDDTISQVLEMNETLATSRSLVDLFAHHPLEQGRLAVTGFSTWVDHKVGTRSQRQRAELPRDTELTE